MNRLAPVAVAFVLALSGRARAGSCDDLVTAARSHESHGDNDVAIREYSDATSLDPSCAAAWLGLGALRSHMGDAAEAERVYTAALSHIPTLAAAIADRARTRWQLGRIEEAEDDMLHFAGASGSHDALTALEELASWYGAAQRAPAQLGVWRRILALAQTQQDPIEARARVRVAALVILVATADPVTHPPRVDLLRSVAARLGR